MAHSAADPLPDPGLGYRIPQPPVRAKHTQATDVVKILDAARAIYGLLKRVIPLPAGEIPQRESSGQLSSQKSFMRQPL